MRSRRASRSAPCSTAFTGNSATISSVASRSRWKAPRVRPRSRNSSTSYAANPPTEIDGSAVVSITNFATETIIDIEGDTVPHEAMLMITLADERRTAVRPSGTEPKIKYYMYAVKKARSRGEVLGSGAGGNQASRGILARRPVDGTQGRRRGQAQISHRKSL